jgi:hypothetical protein
MHSRRKGMGQVNTGVLYQHHDELVRERRFLNSYRCHHFSAANAHYTFPAITDESKSWLNVHFWSRRVVSLPIAASILEYNIFTSNTIRTAASLSLAV